MEPTYITAQNKLTATVEAAAEKALRRLLDTLASAQAGDVLGGKDWLTNREAQTYLGLSKATLARYRADGTLAYSRLNSSVYYRRADIEALLERHAVRAGYGDSAGVDTLPVLASEHATP
ncbi:MAG TPA: helix-turn-helix domain-containing protein [Rubricoccaceae bacterium]